MDRQFFVGEELSGGKPVRSLREIINHLQKVYCGNIGIQYMHIHDPAVKDWLQTQVHFIPCFNSFFFDIFHIFDYFTNFFNFIL